jgi:hypothetical protein
MVRECQICGLSMRMCREHKKAMAYRQCMAIFFAMDAVFGSGIALAIAARSYAALGIFVVAAVTSVMLVVKD